MCCRTEGVRYSVGGVCLAVCGSRLAQVVEQIVAFAPFRVSEGTPRFSFVEGRVEEVPQVVNTQYRFTHEGVSSEFSATADGYLLSMQLDEEPPLYLWHRVGESHLWLSGNLAMRLVRFALWVGYGLMRATDGSVAIHSSCIVHEGRAVLFLGESGTGKSTHTRLWREHITGSFLLNDDSPIVTVESDGRVWVYGSPWSGKTPCYRAERYELQACVRLSQAPANRIRRLSPLHAYAALHPSCPPQFAYDDRLYSGISDTMGRMIAAVPCYHLACLPDEAAARLACDTLFM
ncbi:MAG: hypothetical protein IJ511_10255 [Bacteroides sp.]|nr:hypothetical protein [Bacteroides sp.]